MVDLGEVYNYSKLIKDIRGFCFKFFIYSFIMLYSMKSILVDK